MNMPFYVAPEQVMKDRADYARKGIARGRSLVGFRFDNGVAICAENPSSTLRKVSEIYDRIAFAGVGKYNEFYKMYVVISSQFLHSNHANLIVSPNISFQHA